MIDPEPFEVSEARIKHGDSSWTGLESKRYVFTKNEILTLHNWIKNEYLPHDEGIIAVMKKITDIANEV